MKKLLIMLLFSGSMFAQKQVFNVQRYCIDEKPLISGQCDISGNEYSFVFVDDKKNEVVLFLSNVRMEFKVVKSVLDPVAKGMIYSLVGSQGASELKVNKQQTKMAFAFPDRNIALTVGKSTKS